MTLFALLTYAAGAAKPLLAAARVGAAKQRPLRHRGPSRPAVLEAKGRTPLLAGGPFRLKGQEKIIPLPFLLISRRLLRPKSRSKGVAPEKPAALFRVALARLLLRLRQRPLRPTLAVA